MTSRARKITAAAATAAALMLGQAAFAGSASASEGTMPEGPCTMNGDIGAKRISVTEDGYLAVRGLPNVNKHGYTPYDAVLTVTGKNFHFAQDKMKSRPLSDSKVIADTPLFVTSSNAKWKPGEVLGATSLAKLNDPKATTVQYSMKLRTDDFHCSWTFSNPIKHVSGKEDGGQGNNGGSNAGDTPATNPEQGKPAEQPTAKPGSKDVEAPAPKAPATPAGNSPAPAAAGKSKKNLAETGANSNTPMLVGGAAALVVVGGGLAFFARKRRSA